MYLFPEKNNPSDRNIVLNVRLGAFFTVVNYGNNCSCIRILWVIKYSKGNIATGGRVDG